MINSETVNWRSCERYAREILKKIKKQLNKKEHQYISVQEFCLYMGLKTDEISGIIF